MSTNKTFEEYFDENVLSGIQDKDERTATMRIFKQVAPAFDDYVDEQVDSRVEKALAARGLGERTRVRDHDIRFHNMLDCWRNNGFHPAAPDQKVSYQELAAQDRKRLRAVHDGKLEKKDYVFRDGAFYWDNPFLIPRVIATLVREPQEVVSVLTPLLAKIRFDSPAQSIMIPAVSAYAAGSLDMAEGDPYPEGQFEYAGDITATIGKAGISVRFTEEMIRFSLFDVMSMHLRAAGIALQRWKEQKVADHITAQGDVVFNNASSTISHTTGRDSAGLFNGTLTLQDIHTAYAAMVNDGFVPNALLVNPMAWSIFAQDPTMRNWAYAQGPKQIWQTYRGDVANISAWAAGSQSNGLNNNTFVGDPKQLQTTYTDVPGLFPYPLRIIVSPYIPFDGTNNTTDLILCDANELGILSVNEEPVTDQFEDPERDIMKVKIRERYAINIMNDGKSIRQLKNVIIARSYDFDDKVTWDVGGGSALPTGESFSL